MNKNIRYAVGAIACYGDKVLLVRKVKMMAAKDGPEAIEPMWDFPKGGVESVDIDYEGAILRELREEVGSDKFSIIEKLPDFNFTFDSATAQKIGVDRQVTKMFKLKFFGNIDELSPQDEEIDRVVFVSLDEVLKLITFDNSREYVKQNT